MRTSAYLQADFCYIKVDYYARCMKKENAKPETQSG